MKPLRLFLILMATVALAVPAGADDHDRARTAMEAGEVAPLADVLAAAKTDFRGRMVEAELEDGDDDHDEAWVYELTMLTPGGTVLRLDYDAKTATLLRAKGRGLLKWYKGDPQTLLDKVSPRQRAHMQSRLNGERPRPRDRHRGWFDRFWEGDETDRRHHHDRDWFDSLWDTDDDDHDDDARKDDHD